MKQDRLITSTNGCREFTKGRSQAIKCVDDQIEIIKRMSDE